MKDYEHIKATEKIKDIFDAYYKTMVVFANNYLANIDECEDVVQSAFLQLWEAKLIFPNEIALRSYLYKVVKNKCFNKIKHYKVKEKYQLQKKEEQGSNDLFEEEIVLDESARLLYRAINLLAPRKKQIIELALKGLSNKEIAENLDIGLETVKSLKSKAYKALRLQLDKKA